MLDYIYYKFDAFQCQITPCIIAKCEIVSYKLLKKDMTELLPSDGLEILNAAGGNEELEIKVDTTEPAKYEFFVEATS